MPHVFKSAASLLGTYAELIQNNLSTIEYKDYAAFNTVFAEFPKIINAVEQTIAEINNLPDKSDGTEYTDAELVTACNTNSYAQVLSTNATEYLQDLLDICDISYGYVLASNLPCFKNTLATLLANAIAEYSTLELRLGYFIDKELKKLNFSSLEEFPRVFANLDHIAEGKTNVDPELEATIQQLKTDFDVQSPKSPSFYEVLKTRISIYKNSLNNKELQKRHLYSSQKNAPPLQSSNTTVSQENTSLINKYCIPCTTGAIERDLIIKCYQAIDNLGTENRPSVIDVFAALNIPLMVPRSISDNQYISRTKHKLQNLILLLNLAGLTVKDLQIFSPKQIKFLTDKTDKILCALLPDFLDQDILQGIINEPVANLGLYIDDTRSTLADIDQKAFVELVITWESINSYEQLSTISYSAAELNVFAAKAMRRDVLLNIILMMKLPLDMLRYVENEYFQSIALDSTKTYALERILLQTSYAKNVLCLQPSTLTLLLEEYESISESCRQHNISIDNLIKLPPDALHALVENPEYIHRLSVILMYYYMPRKKMFSYKNHTDIDPNGSLQLRLLRNPICAVDIFNDTSSAYNDLQLQDVLNKIENRINKYLKDFIQLRSMTYLSELEDYISHLRIEFKRLGLTLMQTHAIINELSLIFAHFREMYIKSFMLTQDKERKTYEPSFYITQVFEPRSDVTVKNFLYNCINLSKAILSAPNTTTDYVQKHIAHLYKSVQTLQSADDVNKFESGMKNVIEDIKAISRDNSISQMHKCQAAIYFLSHSCIASRVKCLYGASDWTKSAEKWAKNLNTPDAFEHLLPITMNKSGVILFNNFFKLMCGLYKKSIQALIKPSISPIFLNINDVTHDTDPKMYSALDNISEADGYTRNLQVPRLNDMHAKGLLYSSLGCSRLTLALLSGTQSTITSVRNDLRRVSASSIDRFLNENGFPTRRLGHGHVKFSNGHRYRMLNSNNKSKDTPLTLAIKQGRTALVPGFIAFGASPSLANGLGQTPLLLATTHKLYEVESELFQQLNAKHYQKYKHLKL